MNVLIFNCGSSSQAFQVYQVLGPESCTLVASGKARNVATRTQAVPVVEWTLAPAGGSAPSAGSKTADLSSHRLAAEEILNLLDDAGIPVGAAGHRFVHGGSLFQGTARIDPETLAALETCLPLAPIHNPNSYSVIQVCLERLPGVPQYVVFDTAFHAGLPEESWRYAIPREVAEKHGYRKAGFHGLSCQYVSGRAAELLGRPREAVKLILCHLGTGGSSVTAFQAGRSLDTSMGYSPLAGLVMSTRCGDLDPEIVIDLFRSGYTAGQVSQMLNQQSGLVGLSGYSSNLAEIIQAAEAGNPDCQAAYAVYAHRLKLYLGAYTWLLGGADAIVFTDDIGVRSWKLRETVCAGVEALGVALDADLNRSAPVDRPARVSALGSRTEILVVPTAEELVILQEVLAHF